MGESEWIIPKQPFFLIQSQVYYICDWMKKLWKIRSHTLLLLLFISVYVHIFIFWWGMKKYEKWSPPHISAHIFLVPHIFFLGHGKLTTPTLFGGKMKKYEK